MDRGAWKATVHEVARIRHNLATKPPPPPLGYAENMEERLTHFTILGFCLVFLLKHLRMAAMVIFFLVEALCFKENQSNTRS